MLLRMDDKLQVAEVVKILVYNQIKYAHYTCLDIAYFDPHLNAFRCKKTGKHLAEMCYKWPQVVHDDFVMLHNTDVVWML